MGSSPRPPTLLPQGRRGQLGLENSMRDSQNSRQHLHSWLQFTTAKDTEEIRAGGARGAGGRVQERPYVGGFQGSIDSAPSAQRGRVASAGALPKAGSPGFAGLRQAGLAAAQNLRSPATRAVRLIPGDPRPPPEIALPAETWGGGGPEAQTDRHPVRGDTPGAQRALGRRPRQRPDLSMGKIALDCTSSKQVITRQHAKCRIRGGAAAFLIPVHSKTLLFQRPC